MVRSSFVRAAGLALALYGALGILVCVAVVVVGVKTFVHVQTLVGSLDQERVALAGSVRSMAGTLGQASTGSSDVEQSIAQAQQAASDGSTLARTSAGTFRSLAQALNFQILGAQPFQTAVPQLQQTANQLDQMAGSLGGTSQALGKSRSDVGAIGTDLGTIQQQMNALADTLQQPNAFGLSSSELLPLEVAFAGMCLLMFLQSVFSVLAGLALMHLARDPTRRHVTLVHHHRVPHPGPGSSGADERAAAAGARDR